MAPEKQTPAKLPDKWRAEQTEAVMAELEAEVRRAMAKAKARLSALGAA